MSWYDISKKMHNNETDGTEYIDKIENISENEKNSLINEVRSAHTKIGHCNCEYCNKLIIAVWDDFNSGSWYPYLGNSATKSKTYLYSPIIKVLRKINNTEGKTWNSSNGNNLMNLHARVHCKDWSIRCKEGSLKILCNECFSKTYNRYQVEYNGQLCAISVVEDRGETIESVLKDLHMQNANIIGKGGKF